jgi:hypothetical protein
MTEVIDVTESDNASVFDVTGSDRVSVLGEQELQRAEAMFQDLLGTDKNAVNNSIEMSDDAVNVDDVQKSIYNAQMKRMETVHDEELNLKNNEIEELREQLAKQMKKTIKKSRENLKQDEHPKVKSPIIQKLTLNGEEHTILICHFLPNSGRIGIKFKRFKDGFFVTGVLPDSQAANYAGLNRGLLIFEVVSWPPLKKMGMTIGAQKSQKLVKRIMEAFNQGDNVTIKFMIPPEGVDSYQIEQRVIRPSRPRRRPRRK